VSTAAGAVDLLAPFAGSRLCVVGNVNRDLRLAPIEPRLQLFQDGETPTQSIRETLGGGGVNSALAAAMLGAGRVSFAAKVGADALGMRLGRTLAARGVDARLAVDPRVATGTSINLVWDTGHRHFVSCLPNATSLRFEDVDLSALDGHRHLLRADPWFADAMLVGSGNRKLFEAARKAGLAVSLDINADPWTAYVSPRTMYQRHNALRDVLPLVDVVHGNGDELCRFTVMHGLEGALRKLEHDYGVASVVVHLGRGGAGFYRQGQLIVEPAAPLTAPAVNVTGTGDVLSVCMMLLHDRADLDVREKLSLSNAVVAEYMTGRLNLAPDLLD
jgi:sugar/nucleoside kinase (ribokinase family)